jgi:pilus assembly protein CpaC
LPLLPFRNLPEPSPEVERKFNKYIDRTIDVENTLDITQGRPRLLLLKRAPFRIQIADQSVADYLLITERELSLSGHKTGTTTLNLWFQDPDQPGQQEVLSYLLRVIPDADAKVRLEEVYRALETEINRNFPDSVVRLSLVGDKLLVRGQAKDVEDAEHILQILGQNAPGGPERIPLENANLSMIGTPQDFAQLAEEGVTAREALNEVSTDSDYSSVINMLQIPGVQQVMLKVTVAEVNRSAARAIGAEMRIGDLTSGASFFSLFPIGATGGNLLVNRGDFELAINALKQLNLAKTLAEPNLVTLSGRPASFQAGGSFPVPQISGFTSAGLQGVDFIPFGVQVQFVPVVTDTDRIRMQLVASVSTRDDTNSADIGGTNVPSLTSRNFRTVVELREGQTLAIAGLLQTNYGATSNRIPFVGDTPVLGRLFSSDNNSYDEQELVVLVTPYLVQPLEEHETQPLPGSDLFEPTDVEFFLLGRIDSRYAEDYRTPIRTDCERMKAFRRCQAEFIIGPSGYSPCVRAKHEGPVLPPAAPRRIYPANPPLPGR